jgi:3-oxoacyl-[acyl-carrier protein] reductase
MASLVREAVPHMRREQWGRICLITATGVREPLPGHALSATARSSLWAWAKAASHELIRDGITINTLCPGAHDTDRMKEIDFPGPRGDPEDFGKLAAVLCSAPARFLTGAAIGVDGGSTLALL